MGKFEKLEQFFERIKNLGFWQRLFNWRPVQTLSYEAFEEYKTLVESLRNAEEQVASSGSRVDLLTNDNSHIKVESVKLQTALEVSNQKIVSIEAALTALKSAVASRDENIKLSDAKIVEQQAEIKSLKEKLTEIQKAFSSIEATLASRDETIKQSEKKNIEQQAEMRWLKENLRSVQEHFAAVSNENAISKKTESNRAQAYESKIENLKSITDRVHNEREAEKLENQAREIERLASMKDTWGKHQTCVKESIKMICQKHTIVYVDQVPFKGNPDNTIKICDEFVVFDAKSPSSDELNNFPAYIKQQAESVKKYVKQENVRKDVFLVIPSNTVEVIEQFNYNMADYNVYIVTLDALEPIMLSLKRIEDYEFLDQLTPEEREDICRIIGKFAHITKRKIQIDQFFTREFLNILSKCETALPSEILAKVIEFEKSEKMNPPQEKRAKQISLKDLDSDSEKIRKSVELFVPSAETAALRL